MSELSKAEKAALEHLRVRADARGLEGVSLSYQILKEKWESGQMQGTAFDDDRVQSSSWEPVLGTEAYWLRMQGTGGFRPLMGRSVEQTLAQMPSGSVEKMDLSEGRAVQPGETWLVKLADSITVKAGEYVKASPKSSIGRCFLYVRLIADNHGSFDELHGAGEDVLQAKEDVQTQLWVLVQPLTFSVILRPNIPLLQLRWFKGLDARLTDSEIKDLFDMSVPLLVHPDEKSPVIMEGLQVHLDLKGEDSDGVVGLRARPNPQPIDLGKKDTYDPAKYFDVIRASDRYVMKSGEHLLLLTKEQLYTPVFLNSELRAHWGGGFAGPKHFAGFIDNGFARKLVLEVRSDEIDDIELLDGMPIGKLDIYWTDVTEKPYGVEIGSHYSKQVGPQPSKHFKRFDWGAL